MFVTIRRGISGTAPIVCGIAMMILSGYVFGCSQEGERDDGGQKAMAAKSIEQVLGERTDEWMSIPGVVGTGIGECEGNPCIRIMVKRKTPELQKKIPAEADGFVVDVIETGEFQARDTG